MHRDRSSYPDNRHGSSTLVASMREHNRDLPMNVDCRMNVVAVDARCPNCQIEVCSMKYRAVRQFGSGHPGVGCWFQAEERSARVVRVCQRRSEFCRLNTARFGRCCLRRWSGHRSTPEFASQPEPGPFDSSHSAARAEFGDSEIGRSFRSSLQTGSATSGPNPCLRGWGDGAR